MRPKPHELTRRRLRAKTIFIVAGEHSGDALGAKLMAAIEALRPGEFQFKGVGGREMEREGLHSLFPIEDVAVMGPLNILPALPRLMRRVYIRRSMRRLPPSPIWSSSSIARSSRIRSPSASAAARRTSRLSIMSARACGRGGRAGAKRCAAYVDEVLGLLPFEPEAHARLGGPHCTYVGHPLIERLPEIENADAGGAGRPARHCSKPAGAAGHCPAAADRKSSGLIGVFGETVGVLSARVPNLAVVIPAVAASQDFIDCSARALGASSQSCSIAAPINFAAMKLRRAALAASGTVTLELALANLPMVDRLQSRSGCRAVSAPA